MDIFTTQPGLEMLFRWGHLLAGITWIGLLYYFNFVQGEYFKEAEASAKSDAVQKLVPRALWWFRWGAMLTFLTGLGIMGIRGSGWSVDIYIGAMLGTLMFLNVWLIIWPNQKIVIASTEKTAKGEAAIPEAADAAAQAGLASRTNVLFSVPMLFFMGASAHYPHYDSGTLGILLIFAAILGIQYNASRKALSRFGFAQKLPPAGFMGPLASVKGVIHCGLGLALVFVLILELI
ncbi:urate hydroxylase PuuD [Methylotuvimicrobium sp. KM2]|uniref:urate hydroxylase PuuD n=1 Tax=Methylotuvimicrobium sp. KM2 TaxID=3133976 RepID=UPI0031014341